MKSAFLLIFLITAIVIAKSGSQTPNKTFPQLCDDLTKGIDVYTDVSTISYSCHARSLVDID